MRLKLFIIKSLMVMATMFTAGFTALNSEAYAGCGGCRYASCTCISHGRQPKNETESCWYDPASKQGCDGHNWKYLDDDKICEKCGFKYALDHDGQHCRVEHCNICGANRYKPHTCGGAAETPPIPVPVYYNFNLYANNNMYMMA